MKTAYLAKESNLDLVLKELTNVTNVYGRLVMTDVAPQKSYWSQNIWYDVQEKNIASIGDAAKTLRSIQRNFWPYSFSFHRRTELIREQLAFVGHKAQKFPYILPTQPMGSFALLEQSRMIFTGSCSSVLPNGELEFVENREDPPSRAYLKLWEVFARMGEMPGKGEVCLDLGACPGGWTWVLKELGAKVIAVDRSPLHESLQNHAKIEFRQGNAFSQKPEDYQEVQWLLSDVICYPEKLLELVTLWLSAKPSLKCVCTLKFQGDGHYAVIQEFAKIPGSQIVHLSCNKHELMWVKL